jgi:hypothetical protein
MSAARIFFPAMSSPMLANTSPDQESAQQAMATNAKRQ